MSKGPPFLVSNDDYWGGLPGAAQAGKLSGLPMLKRSSKLCKRVSSTWLDTVLQNAELLAGNDDFNIIDYPVGRLDRDYYEHLRPAL